MIAGTLGLLDEPADEPLESNGGEAGALDVQDTQTYLDEAAVQTGLAAARVETRDEHVYINGTSIDVEEVRGKTKTHTEWVADVETGFALAERTDSGQPPFPWDVFRAACGSPVRTAEIDVVGYIDAQDDPDVWFSGSDAEHRDDVQMDYHASADLSGEPPNIGIGFQTSWQGRSVRGVVYGSGYIAVYNEGVGPVQFARFVREEVLPHAAVPEDDEAESEQQTLDETAESECDRCERESDTVDDSGYCITCRDKLEEDGDDPYGDLDTVTVSDGGDDDA